VDDLLIILDQIRIKGDTIYNFINNIDEYIEFNISGEENNTIQYIDLSISRNENNVDLDIYRKPIYIYMYVSQYTITPTTHAT
jgi:hypothetical protein